MVIIGVVIMITTLTTTGFRQDNTGEGRVGWLLAKLEGRRREGEVDKRKSRWRELEQETFTALTKAMFCSIDCAWDRGMAAYPNSKSVTNTGIPGTEAWQRIQIVRA